MSNDRSKPGKGAAPDAPSDLKVGDWSDGPKPKRRDFPGQGKQSADGAVRASFSATAYADVAGHAKESLKAEICGVLVGNICSDDHGLWVEVLASVRGTATSHGSAHVTFTQETWQQIHADLERLHPKLRIVGWYHSHPGFGVTFSDMDAFIHRNFFSGAGQIALVVDPLSGEDAICCNAGDDLLYLAQCLVDGRERALKRPARPALPAETTSVGGSDARLAALETRLTQLIVSLDDHRERAWYFNLLVGMIVVFAVVGVVVWHVWDARARDMRPPELVQEVAVPVHLGDRDVQLLAHVYAWNVPPELTTAYRLMIETQMKMEAEKAKSDAAHAAEAAPTSTTKPAGTP